MKTLVTPKISKTVIFQLCARFQGSERDPQAQFDATKTMATTTTPQKPQKTENLNFQNAKNLIISFGTVSVENDM